MHTRYLTMHKADPSASNKTTASITKNVRCSLENPIGIFDGGDDQVIPTIILQFQQAVSATLWPCYYTIIALFEGWNPHSRPCLRPSLREASNIVVWVHSIISYINLALLHLELALSSTAHAVSRRSLQFIIVDKARSRGNNITRGVGVVRD